MVLAQGPLNFVDSFSWLRINVYYENLSSINKYINYMVLFPPQTIKPFGISRKLELTSMNGCNYVIEKQQESNCPPPPWDPQWSPFTY